MAKTLTTLAPGMSMPPIVRMFGQPLDNTSLFLTRSDMEQYAASSPLAYVGQILVCYNQDTSGNVEAYIIQNGGSLRPLGAGSDTEGINPKTLRLTGDQFDRHGHYFCSGEDGLCPSLVIADVNGIAGGVTIFVDEGLLASGAFELHLDAEIASWISADDVVTAHLFWF